MGNIWLILGPIAIALLAFILLFRFDKSHSNLRRKVRLKLFGNKLKSSIKKGNK